MTRTAQNQACPQQCASNTRFIASTRASTCALLLALASTCSDSSAQPAAPQAPMEMQATPSVLLPGLYLEDARSPLKIGLRAPEFSLARCAFDPAQARAPQIGLGSWIKANKGNGSNGSVIVFWAFWCDTWKDISRDLNILRPQLAAMKLQVLAVSVDASQQPVSRRAFESGRIWWPVAIDASSTCSARWGVRRVPTTFVLDKNGIVRAVFEGFPGKSTFVKKTAQALRIRAPRIAVGARR